ncbi:hypothetical protein ACFVDQ_13660 [Streptomyces sp. NPDC057684]|uniref:hypothetical protein n=1 Tax=unclassified Streptomyces TaxID=2593676 RepID=UPI0036994207
MVGLLLLGAPTALREAGALGDSLTLVILTISSVITATLITIKGTLDQLPDVLNSWHRAVRAMRETAERRRGRGEDEPPNHADQDTTGL